MPGDTRLASGAASAARRHWTVFGALLIVVLAAKLPVLSTPYHWDESLWIGFAHRLAGGPLWRVIPGLHAPKEFSGRPPGLFLGMAVLFEVFGRSIWLSHLAVAVTRPHDTVPVPTLENAGRVDVVIVDSLHGPEPRALLERHARQLGLPLARRIELDGVWCDVYGAGVPRAAAERTSR